MGIIRIFLLSLLLYGHSAYSSTRHIVPSKVEKVENIGALVKIEKKIVDINGDLGALKRKMSTYEKDLNSKNKKLITSIKRKERIENLIEKLWSQKADLSSEIEKSLNQKRKFLTKLIVERLAGGQGPEKLLANKIIITKVKKVITNLDLKKKQLITLSEDLNNFKNEYQELQRNEKTLSDTLKSLEEQKQKIAIEYLEKRKDKEDLQGKYDKLKTQFVVGLSPEKSRQDYALPIEKYFKMDYKDKGITFQFREKGPVLSPKSGKISYSGRLSTYGNVVIVDHGNEVRSVILGSFTPKLKKGVEVKKNELIGYTKLGEDEAGKLYFEVRQKDKVQNTIFLVEKKFLSNNKSTKI